MTVNYIAEMNAFFDWVAEAEPSANAQLLWHALMSVANSRGSGSDWPDAFFISNRNLLLRLPYSEDTLARAREELVSLGRITCVPGSRTCRPCYRLLPFCAEDAPQRTGEDAEIAEAAGIAGAYAPQSDPQPAPQQPMEAAEPFHTERKNDTHTADDEYVDDPIRAAAVCAWHARVSAKAPRKPALDRFCEACRLLGSPPPLVEEAILQAVENNAENPLRYASAMLQGWSDAGYRTLDDVYEGQGMRCRETWRRNAPMDEAL